MDDLPEVLDLSIVFTPPPPASPSEILAHFAVRCDSLGLSHTGEAFTDPLTKSERDDLRWYLEEYWQWPYLEFAERGKRVEALLSDVGRRFYQALFGSSEAQNIFQIWQQHVNVQHRISIVSEIASILRLPWELLSDQLGFLLFSADHPISMVRRLSTQSEQTSPPTPFQLPLRILLVTARPEGAGFVDPRNISHELMDELQSQIAAGTIEVEFLRPPTFTALNNRLKDIDRPIHVLHFDGHGGLGGKKQQGVLLFEDKAGKPSAVEASDLAKVLKNSDVRLAVLTACQSAMSTSEDEAFSSVSTQLINNGINAVIAMNSSILVTSAALYVEAFYHALAAGLSVSISQEQARQALQRDPHRHLFSRRQDEEAAPVTLAGWWVPQFYQQSSTHFQLTISTSLSMQTSQEPPVCHLSLGMPPEPRYGFSGRAYELLRIERALFHHKPVVLHGFGGIGKTALAREAADWLTRTGMYQGACFVSFEGGRGGVTSLLSQLGILLGVYESAYIPDDPKAALVQLQEALKARHLLVIADNLESILPEGEATLEADERSQLWDVLLELQRMGTGVLLTSRTTAFGDGRLAEGARVMHVRLAGLWPDASYTLATSMLVSLGIDRCHAPYGLLSRVLRRLDCHPLAILLVLPALRSCSLLQIEQDFAAYLPHFTDDNETGHNRSLLASLEYSTQRLSTVQRALLPRLAVFEAGAMEDSLLTITEIPEATWVELRPALEQVALLAVEYLDSVRVPFLHFHPILVPYLRWGQAGVSNGALLARYAERYYIVSKYYHVQDRYFPVQNRVVVQQDLPNLRRALAVLLETGQLERAVEMGHSIGRFLTYFGLYREQARIAQALTAQQAQAGDTLTQRDYLHESHLGEEEKRRGGQAAIARLSRLLARIEALPEGTPHGPGSGEQAITLAQLGQCFQDSGDLSSAEQVCRRAVAIVETLIKQDPENRGCLELQANLLADLGDVLRMQGRYADAKAAHEQRNEWMGDMRGQAVSRAQLGTIALEQGDYAEAQQRYQQALATFQALDEPAREHLGDLVDAARTCSHLGQIAQLTDRFEEAKGWLQRALVLGGQVDATSEDYATHLSNLACLLVQEVEEGRVQDTSAHLGEAQRYLEQALVIDKRQRSPDIWKRYGLLAWVANQQGHVKVAQDYRRREREAYAAFAGRSESDDRQRQHRLPAFAAARDNQEVRAQVEKGLPQMEENGWHISEALQRIWTGERDWHALAEGLDNTEALLVLCVLETLAKSTNEAARPPETPQETTEG